MIASGNKYLGIGQGQRNYLASGFKHVEAQLSEEDPYPHSSIQTELRGDRIRNIQNSHD